METDQLVTISESANLLLQLSVELSECGHVDLICIVVRLGINSQVGWKVGRLSLSTSKSRFQRKSLWVVTL